MRKPIRNLLLTGAVLYISISGKDILPGCNDSGTAVAATPQPPLAPVREPVAQQKQLPGPGLYSFITPASRAAP